MSSNEGKPFMFPGCREVYEGFSDGSDSNLIAEQEIWAGLDPNAKNQAFNTVNGDQFKWKHLWKVLAQQFDVEVPEFEGPNLEELMKGKGPVWDEIVKKYELYPTSLDQVGMWWFVDCVFNLNWLNCMNKSKEHGTDQGIRQRKGRGSLHLIIGVGAAGSTGGAMQG